MPGRFVTAVILVCWLAVGSWFVLRDLVPQMAAEQPPRLTIDLVDEARKASREVLWEVERTTPQGDKIKYNLRTATSYLEPQDQFSMTAFLTPRSMAEINIAELKSLKSEYVLSRDGTIHSYEADVNRVHADTPRRDRFIFTMHQRKLSLERLSEQGTFSESRVTAYPELQLSHRGMIQTPYQPVQRLERVWPGRTWRVPFFDPVRASLFNSAPELGWVDAAVRPQKEDLLVRQKTLSCVVIDLVGDNVRGTIWQDTTNGELVRLEWTLGNERWVIQQLRDLTSVKPIF